MSSEAFRVWSNPVHISEYFTFDIAVITCPLETNFSDILIKIWLSLFQ